MKKIILLLLLSILILSSSGCNSTEKIDVIDNAHYKYGQKALEIADQCLNFEITPEEAHKAIDSLCESRNKLPTTNIEDDTHFSNFGIESDVSGLNHYILSYKLGYSDYDKIQEVRNRLYEDLNNVKVVE